MDNPQNSVSSDSVAAIIQAATRAPSAENIQPWKLQLSDDQIQVYHDSSQAMVSDIDSMLALTGIGALIESIVLAASTIQLEAKISYQNQTTCTDSKDAPLRQVASVALLPNGEHDRLAEHLESRCTIRRMSPRPQITCEQLSSLKNSAARFNQVRIDWVDRELFSDIARLTGLANRLRFEHRPFHREFYENIRFAKSDVQTTRNGLDAATLQLPFGVATVLRTMRSWPLMRAANRLGFSRTVASQADAEIRSSGAIGLLSVDQPSAEAFLNGGRAMQRAWLEATRLGLAFHPMASMAVYARHAEPEYHDRLPSSQVQSATQMRATLHEMLPSLRSRTLQLAFRLGHGDVPKIRTLRRTFNAVTDLTVVSGPGRIVR